MILGILSDSHGRWQRTRAAIRLLREQGATALVHCGDLCGDEVLEALAEMPAAFVWGNNDDDSFAAQRYAESLGLVPPREIPLRIDHDGKRIAVFHGHELAFEQMVRALRSGAAQHGPESVPDYVLFGHSHAPHDERIGGMRLINPGALHRAARFTVCTLDLRTDTARWLDVS